ncbi:MAG TPA: energy-coupling factor ABC transporter permease [Dehalococcoidia bacterium]|jgi:cobalt/nickel transport system permease protein|nr:energy-coupling factor ABC transporter permease [Dehalococcoidia bacterium]
MAYIPSPIEQQPVDPPALHIPDGFLSGEISVVGYIVTGIVLAIALRQASQRMGEKAAPLMGVLAAFIFAAQMINFPVAGGTSGHLLGGTLAAILLGPWAAIIVMTSVVSVQALVFQDGGLAVLGVNIFNMGIVTAFVGYAIYRTVDKLMPGRPTLRLAGAFAGAWVSVMVAAALTSVQLAISDTSPLDVALPAMLGVHALIGIGEGLITVAAIALVLSSRPDLVEGYDEEEGMVATAGASA